MGDTHVHTHKKTKQNLSIFKKTGEWNLIEKWMLKDLNLNIYF